MTHDESSRDEQVAKANEELVRSRTEIETLQQELAEIQRGRDASRPSCSAPRRSARRSRPSWPPPAPRSRRSSRAASSCPRRPRPPKRRCAPPARPPPPPSRSWSASGPSRSVWCRRSRTRRLATPRSWPPRRRPPRQPRPRGDPPHQSGTPGQPDREAHRGRGARALRRAAVRRRGRAAGGGRGRAASPPDGEGAARPAVGASRGETPTPSTRRRSPTSRSEDRRRIHAVHEGARARREEVALAHLGAHADHEVQEGLEGPGAADQAADGRGAALGPHGRRPRRGRRARPRRRGPHDQADRPRSAAEARRRRVGHRRRSRRPHRQPAAGRGRRLAPRRTGHGRPAPLLRRPHGDGQGHHGPARAAWTAAR